GKGESQLDMCRRIHLPLTAYAQLADLCHSEGLGFMSTPFDLVSIDTLVPLDMDWWKIPSGEITNLPYLRRIARLCRPVIMSTGMSTIDEITRAMEILTSYGLDSNNIALLHCNTQYPTPMADVNLRAMDSLRSVTRGPVGYSDHTAGIEVPIAAVAMGAQIIEKHFTLDKSLPGPDHKASLDPGELADMVRAIRNIEQALGSPVKQPSPSETPNIEIARKSIVAARDIKAGEIFSPENITVKRPGGGLSPMMWDSVIGLTATQDFKYDQLITI
ncbi:MAG: N-acetylneuraminate synthase family protein, partial [Muribaculaceae bacterium]|nr:N-acetylneuraminate synthase family protein [Muribaculaceae bacterium]